MKEDSLQSILTKIFRWMIQRVNFINENHEIINLCFFDTIENSMFPKIMQEGKIGLDSEAFIWESPIINIIDKMISHCNTIGFFYDDTGKFQNVCAFEMKDISKYWRKECINFSNNIGSLSGYCNCHCEFCYEKNSPLKWPKRMLTVEEVKSRLNYYDREENLGVVAPISKSMEPFTNPNLFEILELMRQNSEENITLITNGSYLTEENIKKLVKIKPVNISISLNSSSSETRKRVMQDPTPEVAILAPKLLNEYKIIYQATLVAWPTIDLNDIIKTIYYLDENNAREIVIHLPSYNRYNFPESLEMDTNYWDTIVGVMNQLKNKINTPIKTFPVNYLKKELTPVVESVYVNSPAMLYDIQKGDIIKEVNGIPVFTSLEADLLLDSFAVKNEEIHISIMRNDKLLSRTLPSLEIFLDDELYPWNGKKYPLMRPYTGIYLINDFHMKYIKDIENILSKYQTAKKHYYLYFSIH
ncbi:MAG: radical SAM protein [Halanaerobiales bacterium]|nr:radical SAM protein [Halanaerobiales bacterium]